MGFLLELVASISWAAVGIAFIATMFVGAFLEDENIAGAFFATVIAIVIIGFGVFNWRESLLVVEQIPQYLAYVAAYVVIGIIWSVFKWIFYMRTIATGLMKDIQTAQDKYRTRDDFLEKVCNSINSRLGSIAESCVCPQDFQKEEVSVQTILKKIRLSPASKKPLIYAWIFYWPISAFTTTIREVIINFVNHLFTAIRSIYIKVSEKAISSSINSVVTQKSE